MKPAAAVTLFSRLALGGEGGGGITHHVPCLWYQKYSDRRPSPLLHLRLYFQIFQTMKTVDLFLCVAGLAMIIMWVGVGPEADELGDVQLLSTEVETRVHKLWKAAKADRSQMFTILSALRNGTNGTYTENDDVTSDETLTNANYITVSSTQISAGATFTLVGTTTVTAAQTFTGGGKFVFAANSIVLMSATVTVSTTGGF